MIKSYCLASGRIQPDDHSPNIWLCVDPDEDERAFLQATIGINAQAIDSSLDPDEVARIEFQGSHLFIVWKRPEKFDGRGFDVSSFGFLLSDEKLVVISESNSLLDGFSDSKRVPGLLDVMLTMLAESVHQYLGHLRVVKLVARELQQRFTQSMKNDHLIQMFNLSESLIYYVNAIQSNGAVLSLLREHLAKHGANPSTLESIDNLIIENEQGYRQANIYSAVFSGLIEARGNLANNNMNSTLRNLTLINVVFLPLNLIASIGGMSEFSMITKSVPWWVSFPSLLLTMSAIAALMTILLRKALNV